MAIGTATAIGLGISALSSGMSFVQAGKQRKLQEEAEREAEKAFQEAKNKLDVNYLEGLAIAKEPYELEREALLQAGASALQAGVEGETRGAAAVAGQALMAQQAGAAGQRAAMSREMQALNQLAAQEDSRLQGARVDLDLAEAKGQQQMAADAAAARQAAISSGVQGIASMGMTALENAPLYDGKEGLREARQFTRQQNPTRRTRRLGNADIQTVNQIDPNSIVQPGITAPIFKID
jgi:hypothetical protein